MDGTPADHGELTERSATAAMPPLARAARMVFRPRSALPGLASVRLGWIAPLLILAALLWAPAQIPRIRELQLERQRTQLLAVIDRGILPTERGEEMLARLDEQRAVAWPQRFGQLGLGIVSLLLVRLMFPALLLWIGVRYLMQGEARYPAVLSALAFSGLPAGIREIVRTPLQLAKDSLDVYFSPAVLTGTESVGGYALSQIELFDAWILGLLVAALAQVGRISVGRSAGLVLPLWAVYTLLKIAYRASPFGVGV